MITMRWILITLFFLAPQFIYANAVCNIDGGIKSCYPINQWNYKRWYLRDAHYGNNLGATSGYETDVEAKAAYDLNPTIPWSVTDVEEDGYVYGWGSRNKLDGSWYGWVVKQERELAKCPSGSSKVLSSSSPTKYACALPPKPKCNAKASFGNPCSAMSGNKYLNETDWQSRKSPLKLTRFYSSLAEVPWVLNYNQAIEYGEVQDINLTLKPQSLTEPNTAIVIYRDNNRKIIATSPSKDKTLAEDWFIDKDENLKLMPTSTTETVVENGQNVEKKTLTGWKVTNTKTGTVETYSKDENNKGKLKRIDYRNGHFIVFTSDNGVNKATDNFGDSLTYNDTNGTITSVTLPNGKQVTYGHDAQNRLSTVTRPGYGTKTYVYDEADKAPNDNPKLLTGIIDENGKRYANYAYDAQNRGVLTEHAHNSQRFTFDYISYYTEVVDEYGSLRRYYKKEVSGTNRITGSLINYDEDSSIGYDNAGNVIRDTKHGKTTTYQYNSRNLQTQKVEASGTADAKTTTTVWHATLPVRLKVTESGLRETSYTHDAKGNVLSKTIKDLTTNEGRTWTYTYNAQSQRTSMTDPLGLTTRWAYGSNGNLLSVTDTQGRQTTYANHNADGQAQTITSPTGQVTKLTYDDAGRILTQTVTISTPQLTSVYKKAKTKGLLDFINWWRKLFNLPLETAGGHEDIQIQVSQTATTVYKYDGVGQLTQVKLPDGEVLTYEYDDAHRLVAMTDSLGNETRYTLNGAGDITQTTNKDSAGILKRKATQVYNNLGRLTQTQGNNGQYNKYNYDRIGNLTSDQDALARNNRQGYDALNRKVSDTDADNKSIGYQYNGLDQLIKVTDTKNNSTTYTVNAFGETTKEVSPDSGTTLRAYDRGRLTKVTDAQGRVINYSYDAKGRLTQRTDANNILLAQYSYDAYGRISKLTDQSGTTDYQYDSANRIIEKLQTIDAKVARTRYRYTAGSKLDQQLLPSGKLIEYGYNKGVLKNISAKYDGSSTPLIKDITYDPNGISKFTYAQTNETVTYSHDLDGRLTSILDPALQRSISYDTGNRITNITDGKAQFTGNYVHDRLDRLTTQNLGQTNLVYAYDANSNRTQKTNNGNVTSTPIQPTSNKLTNVSYDASGRITNDGIRSYSYNTEGRLQNVSKDNKQANYKYNALSQRVKKQVGNDITYFSYDEQGKLIGEYTKEGKLIREFIYLGNQPIGLFSSEKPQELLQIHTDHLGTPRAVTSKDKTVLWKWEGDAFGDVQPQIQKIKLPLRMAGQYFDAESGLFYNWYRYYIPELGRYNRPDPLGLTDGTNPYNYVHINPLLKVDPKGKNAVGIGALVWVSACGYWAYQKGLNAQFNSNSVNPDLPPGDDKKRHCYSSCLLTKCMLGLPVAYGVGVIKEAVDTFIGSSEIDDIRANNVGIGYAYQGKECKKTCDGKTCSL